MGRYSRIFQNDTQDEEEIKPMYEHLDGTVEVLGFEAYAIATEAYGGETEEINEMSDSLEADITLLETISGQQREVSRQDSTMGQPNYNGLEIDQGKIQLTDDTKKILMDKGMDYRKFVSEEGFVDKVKEIWQWIVDKITAWWDRLWGGDKKSKSDATSKENKENLEKVKKDNHQFKKDLDIVQKVIVEHNTTLEKVAKGEVKDIPTDVVEKAKRLYATLNKFPFDRYAILLSQDGGKSIDIMNLSGPIESHIKLIEHFNQFIDAVNKVYTNQIGNIVLKFKNGSLTNEEFVKLNEEALTHFKEATKSVFIPVPSLPDAVFYQSVRKNDLLSISFADNTLTIKTVQTPQDDKRFVETIDEGKRNQIVQKALEGIERGDFASRHEAYIRNMEKLIPQTQALGNRFDAIGKLIKELKVDDQLKDVGEGDAKIATTVSRYLNGLLTLSAYIKTEIAFLEEFTAAFINFLDGFSSAKGVGAIKDPHAKWGN